MPGSIYRFGAFTLDTTSFRLLRGDEILPASPKIVDLLLYLVQRPSALVTKEDLFKALWPDVIVTENALTQAVSELRQALGDDPSSPRYIQTVARRGYRFIAAIDIRQTEPVRQPHTRTADEAAGREAPNAPRSIAVTDFVNVTADREFAWLATGIAETVASDLRAIKELKIIDRVRVVEAVKRGYDALAELASTLDVELVVVGSFQRSGDRLRITARVVRAATGETVADAKADGPLAEVFNLQDRIVSQFASDLGLSAGPATTTRLRIRETANLEAYRAFTEGRLRLEALDASLVPAAMADFERAIAMDPNYAVAYVGLANACFWLYEQSRDRNQPDTAMLAASIDHAQRAIDLDEQLAEAHATLALLLVSAGRSSLALEAARRAARLEPGYWGHQFRLGHAAWGEERIRAQTRALELYPEFPFAYFEIAMVHIARRDLDLAAQALQQGLVVLDRQQHQHGRFPAKGLHWLYGLVRLAQGEGDDAESAFRGEIASGGTPMYAREFTIAGWDGLGFAALQRAKPLAAIDAFREALALYPSHARSQLGLVVALRAANRQKEAAAALTRARAAIDELCRGPRRTEAALMLACDHVVDERFGSATETLAHLFNAEGMPSFAGWIIPIEPILAPLRARPEFQPILDRLAVRAK